MVQLLRLLCGALIGLFESSARREAEILVLRQQINVLRRKSPKRPALNNADRLLFVWLSRLVPTTLAALAVVSPETVVRWHRAGFRAYWRLRSRPHGGRPKTPLEIRQLIREMSIANSLWDAPRIPANQTYSARRREPSRANLRMAHRFYSNLYAGNVVSRLSSTGPPTVKW
jgi:hypothetical protein